MPKGPQLTTEMRVACIVMRYQAKMQHEEIARELNLNPSSVRNTCSRAQKSAGSTELLELLKHCRTQPRSGRPPRKQPRTRKANKIKPAVPTSTDNEEGAQSSATTSSNVASNTELDAGTGQMDTWVPETDSSAIEHQLPNNINDLGVGVDEKAGDLLTGQQPVADIQMIT